MAKEWLRLKQLRKEVALGVRLHARSAPGLPPEVGRPTPSPELHSRLTRIREQASSRQSAAGPSEGPVNLEELQGLAAELRREMRLLERAEQWKGTQARGKAFRRLLRGRPKIGNKRATGAANDTPPDALKAMVDPDTKETLTDPEAIKSMIHRHMTKLTTAPGGTNEGRYLPNGVERGYPFAQPDATDRFTLHGAEEGRCRWLHESIADGVEFQRCVRTLAHCKAPGPDGVVNEVIHRIG